MGYIGVTTHLPTIDPNFQRDIQVSHSLPQKKTGCYTSPQVSSDVVNQGLGRLRSTSLHQASTSVHGQYLKHLPTALN